MQQVADVLAGALPLTDHIARTHLEVELAHCRMRPHPLFAAFVKAARERHEGRLPRLPLPAESAGSK